MSESFATKIRRSVIAVPPLARNKHLEVCAEQNARLIRHIETGGVTTFLYGGNALFYHIRLSEYADTLHMLRERASPDSWIIPSLGPSFGMMMDQAEILADMPFDTAMILPQKEIADEQGIVEGITRVVERLGKPIVLYLKFDRWLTPASVGDLVRRGAVSWIKYAVVRKEPADDPYLIELMHEAPKDLFVSGMGEQPAIVHMQEFGMSGFTSGCVCVHPVLSARLLRAVQEGDWDTAEICRERFRDLEDLRNAISPIRVLHTAVAESGISDTGPLTPLVGPLNAQQTADVSHAVRRLCAAEDLKV